jgi:hypothetical protein
MISVKNMYLIQGLLSAFVIRAILMGSGLGDSLIVVGLCALYGFVLFHDKKDEAFKKEMLDQAALMRKDAEDIKAIVGSMKLANSLRSMGTNNVAGSKAEISDKRRF